MGRIGRFLRRWWAVLLVALAVAVGAGWWSWSRWNTSRLLRDGEEALTVREYARARELLNQYLAARPHDAGAHLLAARAARRLKDYYAAREHLRLSREAGGDREAIDVETDLIELQRGDDRPVERLRARAEVNDDLALVVREGLIQYDLDASQLWQALDGLNKYLERRPNDLQALIGRGFVWEQFLYFTDAVADYQRAVAAHPESERARLKLADTLLIVGPPQEALTAYQCLAERRPDRPEVRLGLARCHRQLGDTEVARSLLDGLLAEDPHHPEALWELGQLALDDGQPTYAEPLIRRALERLPYDRRIHFTLYRCLLAQRRHLEAEAVQTRVTQLDADVRRIDQVRLEVMKRPADAELRYEGGMLFLRNGEPAAGIRWLQMALRLDPNHRAARQALEGARSRAES